MSKLAPTPFQTCSSIVQANIRSRGAWFGCCTDKQLAEKNRYGKHDISLSEEKSNKLDFGATDKGFDLS